MNSLQFAEQFRLGALECQIFDPISFAQIVRRAAADRQLNRVVHLVDSSLDHLLRAGEARLVGDVGRGAIKRHAESSRRCDGVHLRMDADALVVGIAESEVKSVIAAVADVAVAAISPAFRSAVVSGRQHAVATADDHGPDVLTFTFGSGGNCDCFPEVVVDSIRPIGHDDIPLICENLRRLYRHY